MTRRIVALLMLVLVMITSVSADFDESVLSDMIGEVFDYVGSAEGDSSDLVDSWSVGDEPDSSEPESDSDSSNLSSSSSNLYVVSTPQYSISELGNAFYSALVRSRSEEIDEYSSISDVTIVPLYTLDSGTTVIPSGTFRSVLSGIIGPYSPVVVQYQYTNGSNTQYLREILPDYQWMISAAIFALMVYCVFRLWGSVLCRR